MSKADWLASWLGEKSKLGKVTAKKMFRGDAEKEGLLVIPIMRRPLRTWLAASRQAAFWATALDLRRSLELLATLIEVRLWVSEGSDRKTSRVTFAAGPANAPRFHTCVLSSRGT